MNTSRDIAAELAIRYEIRPNGRSAIGCTYCGEPAWADWPDENPTSIAVYSAVTGEGFEIDHIVPLHRQGLDDATNVVIACRSCNRRKATAFPGNWEPEIYWWDC